MGYSPWLRKWVTIIHQAWARDVELVNGNPSITRWHRTIPQRKRHLADKTTETNNRVSISTSTMRKLRLAKFQQPVQLIHLLRERPRFSQSAVQTCPGGPGKPSQLSLARLRWHGTVGWSLRHESDSGSVREIVFSTTTKRPHYCTTYFIEWAYPGLLQVVIRTENPSPLPCW